MAEVNSPGDTEYSGVGFRSTQSITGNFSHTFTTPGTYYYITEGYAHIGNHELSSLMYKFYRDGLPLLQDLMAVSLFSILRTSQLSSPSWLTQY